MRKFFLAIVVGSLFTAVSADNPVPSHDDLSWIETGWFKQTWEKISQHPYVSTFGASTVLFFFLYNTNELFREKVRAIIGLNNDADVERNGALFFDQEIDKEQLGYMRDLECPSQEITEQEVQLVVEALQRYYKENMDSEAAYDEYPHSELSATADDEDFLSEVSATE